MPDDQDPTELHVEGGDAQLPDADEAPDVEDLLPEDPPDEALASGDPEAPDAIAAPVPAHGEMASRAQLDEGVEARESSA